MVLLVTKMVINYVLRYTKFYCGIENAHFSAVHRPGAILIGAAKNVNFGILTLNELRKSTFGGKIPLQEDNFTPERK